MKGHAYPIFTMPICQLFNFLPFYKIIVHKMVNTSWTPSGERMLDTILCTFY